MIKEYTSKTLRELRRDYPSFFFSLPREVLADPEYIFRVDTVRNIIEIGYRSDDWHLK